MMGHPLRSRLARVWLLALILAGIRRVLGVEALPVEGWSVILAALALASSELCAFVFVYLVLPLTAFCTLAVAELVAPQRMAAALALAVLTFIGARRALWANAARDGERAARTSGLVQLRARVRRALLRGLGSHVRDLSTRQPGGAWLHETRVTLEHLAADEVWTLAQAAMDDVLREAGVPCPPLRRVAPGTAQVRFRWTLDAAGHAALFADLRALSALPAAAEPEPQRVA